METGRVSLRKSWVPKDLEEDWKQEYICLILEAKSSGISNIAGYIDRGRYSFLKAYGYRKGSTGWYKVEISVDPDILREVIAG